MNTEDTIIALLSGDITDVAEVEALLRQLADSPQHMELLLEHASMTGGLRQLGIQTLPGADAVRGVMDGIAGIESEYQQPAVPTAVSYHRTTLQWRSVLAGAMLVLGFLAGFLTGGTGGDSEGPIASVPSESGSTSEDVRSQFTGRAEERLFPFLRDDTGEVRDPVPGVDPDSSALERLGVPFPDGRSVNSAQDVSASLSGAGIGDDLQLIVPVDGEKFSVGDVVPVVWNRKDEKMPVQIEVSSDGGHTWSQIARDQRGHRYLWRVPDNAVIGDNYLMRIRSFSRSGEYLPDGELPAPDISVDAVDISPDGTLLACSYGNNIILWDVETRTRIMTLRGHLGLVYYLRFSPDGTRLISSSVDDHAILWNVADGKIKHKLDGDGGTMWRCAFSPDGTRIATAQDDGSVIIWDALSGREVRKFPTAHEQGVRFIEFTPDGKRLLTSSSDRTAAILDIATGKRLLEVVHHPEPIRSRVTIVNGVQLTPDGSTLITCGYNGYVKFWNAKTGKLIRERVYHDSAYVVSIRLSRNGKWLAAVGYDGSTKILDPHTGDVLASLSLNDGEQVSPMVRSAFGPDDRMFAVGHADGRISLWKLKQESDVSEGVWTIRACKDQTGIDRGQDGDTMNSTPVNLD